MITVKELAEKLGVSRVSIYRRINDTFKNEIKPFTIKKEGVTYLLNKRPSIGLFYGLIDAHRCNFIGKDYPPLKRHPGAILRDFIVPLK